MSALEAQFSLVLLAHGLKDNFEREYRFHPERKWRFDFADPVNKVAVEIDGGVFGNGRHSRGAGFRSDCEKLNAAAALGWRVFRYVERKGMSQFISDYNSLLKGRTL